jgi:signal transduction histidine kinase
MDSPYFPQRRAECLIATGRVVLGAFTLLAIWLDPSEPAKYAKSAYSFPIAYLVYALLVALLVLRPGAPLGRMPLITHVLDLAVFSLFIYFFSIFIFFTEGATSPFILYFVFLLLAATLRWQWRGTLWTALAALATFIGMGVYGAGVLRDPVSELPGLIIHGLYLGLVAVFLGVLGAHETRVRRELSMLAGWPRSVPREARPLVREVLEHAASILGSPRLLIAWQVGEEPWLNLALWPRGEIHWSREAPGTFLPLVAEPLADADFLCQNVRAEVPSVLHTSPAGVQRWRGLPLHTTLQAWFAISAVLSLRLRGETLKGRLLSLDRSRMTSDDLGLGEIVARLVTARMDHFYLLQGLQQAAVTDEHMRLARDLHDGLLQSLAGVALQLETVRRLLEEEPQAAMETLLEIQRLIATQQRDLRFLIHGLKRATIASPEAEPRLGARLDELAKRIERDWGLRVELKKEHLEAGISKGLADEIYHIASEALVNAARHANASVVGVEVGMQDNQVRIVVADNGTGFPFRGQYDHAALTDMKLGPVMLKERIASVGGSLSINSTDFGARLEITLPLAHPGV